MKRTILFLLGFSWFSICQVLADEPICVSSPSKTITLSFQMSSTGEPMYEAKYKNKPVIISSHLGLEIEGFNLKDELRITDTQRKNIDEQWNPVWGEEKTIRNRCEELTIKLKQTISPEREMNIVFRVFDDGIGFRYEFPEQAALKNFIVTKEITEFSLTGNHKAFWIPGNYDANAYPYTISRLSEVNAWKLAKIPGYIPVINDPDQNTVQTPLLLKTDEGLYINIHEAALLNYPAMLLHIEKDDYKLTANLVPDAFGNKAYLRTPFHTPWRTIIVGDKATDIIASRIILNLNEPSKIKDTSWIKPLKFIGVWWEMITGNSTWSYANSLSDVDSNGKLKPSGKHGANTANVKRYIDFASKHGINNFLAEGWNTGWEEWYGYWKEDIFDFITPYPDFDIEEIASYAKSKKVSLLMHHETSGSVTNYERQMDTAYRMMKHYEYPFVKTGHVGRIIPRGEHHDGQWMVNYYSRVAQKTADYKIMVDMHEVVRPTGLQRTYPNWLACESGRGNEVNGFTREGTAPSHETILPFTRLVGGPMDFTPGLFKLRNYNEAGFSVHTTLAKQLALYVVFYSPVQMLADLPENYEKKPDAFEFLKEVPVEWDKTLYLDAEPGEFLMTARQQKDSENWYVGAITNENSRSLDISLSFLDKGKNYIATIYSDAIDASWKDNPEAYTIKKMKVTAKTNLKIKLADGGGVAISIKPE